MAFFFQTQGEEEPSNAQQRKGLFFLSLWLMARPKDRFCSSCHFFPLEAIFRAIGPCEGAPLRWGLL